MMPQNTGLLIMGFRKACAHYGYTPTKQDIENFLKRQEKRFDHQKEGKTPQTGVGEAPP